MVARRARVPAVGCCAGRDVVLLWNLLVSSGVYYKQAMNADASWNSGCWKIGHGVGASPPLALDPSRE